MKFVKMRYMKALMVALATAYSVMISAIFATAYYNPSKTVLIDINYFGEAKIEAVMLIVMMPIMVISNWIVIKEITRGY